MKEKGTTSSALGGGGEERRMQGTCLTMNNHEHTVNRFVKPIAHLSCAIILLQQKKFTKREKRKKKKTLDLTSQRIFPPVQCHDNFRCKVAKVPQSLGCNLTNNIVTGKKS